MIHHYNHGQSFITPEVQPAWLLLQYTRPWYPNLIISLDTEKTQTKMHQAESVGTLEAPPQGLEVVACLVSRTRSKV